MKRCMIYLGIFLLFILMPVVKAEEKISLYLFYGDGCPHCSKEKEFLEEVKSKYPNVEIHTYETWYNDENSQLLRRVKNALGTENNYVPYTVIGETGYTGYNENIGYQLENKIKNYHNEKDIVKEVIQNPLKYDKLKEKFIDENKNDKNDNKDLANTVVVPFLGKINAKTVSLPILAIVIGLVDGFNPCAMWVLLFLIGMLVGMKDHKRMWILGLTFLFTSAFVYFLFMMSWLKVAMGVSSIAFVRIIIAVVAFLAGIVNLYGFFRKNDNGCDIVDDKKRKKIFQKIKKFTKEKHLFPALVGIMVLAVTVNIIELACSAGLPLLFTQVLSMNHLNNVQYLFYIVLYIFFFLIDDMIVFIIAMVTLKATGISTKYGKYSHLIGGIIMVLIAVLLFFKPEILMFNF